MRRLQAWAAVILAAALGACQGPQPPKPMSAEGKAALAFDGTNSEALVVARVSAPGYRGKRAVLHWTCYDPAKGVYCPERDFSKGSGIGWDTAFSGFTLGFAAPQPPPFSMTVTVQPADLFDARHQLQRVGAGNYILDFIETEEHAADRYWVVRKTIVLDRTKSLAESRAPRFRAEAGKVHYLGDFEINALTFPAKLGYGRDIAALKQALAAYGNVKAPLAVVRLQMSDRHPD